MNKNLPYIPVNPRTGDERLHAGGRPLKETLLDYWRWSRSDLLGNTSRGVLAEFLVGSALRMTDKVRDEWASYDLLTPSGIKVEVKNSAYLQSWQQKTFSRISFDIAKKEGWDPRTNKIQPDRKRRADVYVFCLLAHQDQTTLDPLDLDQWEFFVLATCVLNEQCGEQKTIGLTSLQKLGPVAATYKELRQTVERVAARTA